MCQPSCPIDLATHEVGSRPPEIGYEVGCPPEFGLCPPEVGLCPPEVGSEVGLCAPEVGSWAPEVGYEVGSGDFEVGSEVGSSGGSGGHCISGFALLVRTVEYRSSAPAE
ncbi:transcription elongation factor SPT6 [Striga asiatica]|uniref:Transcription elongation factor SPT6 n=1 Tax=Striga asiatica TaxID=4170 RepID=A0A5A7PGQ2_STRAF|nr:transcription elongation factor SPT6 [Striga asiatica]